MVQSVEGHAEVGGCKAGTPNKATAMKEIIDRLAKEDGELVYDAIRAALNAHGEPISMTAVRICLEYGIGLPQKTAQEGGHSTLVVRLSPRRRASTSATFRARIAFAGTPRTMTP